RDVEPAVAISDVQIDVGETGRHDDAIVGRRAIADAVETQPGAREARPELVTGRESARPRLLRREGETSPIFAVGGGKLGPRERRRPIGSEPRRELVPPLELDAEATRARAHAGRPLVTVPRRLVVEVEKPSRGRQIEAVPEPRPRSELIADGPRQRR